jgi:glycyl-tRNA synthetase beta chain
MQQGRPRVADLLFEIGTEELPARFVGPALDDMQRIFEEKCAAAAIAHGALKRFGTPRRLALLVHDVVERTDDVQKEVQGPPVKAAFDADGKPKVPATKFAESVGLAVEQLKRVQTPKGEYLAAVVHEKGKRTIELMPDVLAACMRGIAFPKSMRWSDVDMAFARPVQWIVALLGSDVVPIVFADVKSGRQTRGHRFLAPANIALDKPGDYERLLETARVVADIDKRRAMLLERIADAARAAGGKLIDDPELVEQVVNLVELPCPVVGTFDARHLDLPPEVLIQEMKGHQRYFSLVGEGGKLLPKFIAVSNTQVKDEKLSLKGYERVLRARLTDGRFFFDEDRRAKLESRVDQLQRVMWQHKLKSTYADKVGRFRELAVSLAEMTGKSAQRATIERAATLAKADLVTGMVREFPELQGVMGREYALHDGESPEVALAIFEHYLPRGASDGLPTQDAGALIGIADRLDTICGLFAVGEKPTGAKDPFALRRAAIGVINIVLGRGYRLSLGAAIDRSLALLAPNIADVKRKPGDAPVREQVLEFFRGRLASLWSEKHRDDIVDAVLAAGFDDLVAAQKRIEALALYVKRPDFPALAATFKRVGNIVQKQAADVDAGPVDPSKLVESAERVLEAEVAKVRDTVLARVRADDYAGALAKVVPLSPLVDAFFDHVMVMSDDKLLRENRVRLLMEISALFMSTADFARIRGEA